MQAIAAERAAGTGARIKVTADPADGLAGVDFVYTDGWVSMGEPKEIWAERVELLRQYQVNRLAMELTAIPRAKFMHCLPAFHDHHTEVGGAVMDEMSMPEGLEVTDEVFSSPRSIVFDQAENRLHTIKAILVATLG